MFVALRRSEDESSGMSPEVLAELKAEAQDLLESLGFQANDLLEKTALESEIDSENIGLLFRTLHTLKGLSQMAGQDTLVAALHIIEDRVGEIRESKRVLGPAEAESLAEIHGALSDIFELFPALPTAENTEKLSALAGTFGQSQTQAADPGPESEMSAADEPMVRATDSVSSESSSIESVSAESVTAESVTAESVSFEATAEELESLTKFQTRSEELFACVFDPGVHANRDTLLSSDVYDNLSRIADFIALRAGEEGSFICFAAELSDNILESVISHKVYLLPKGSEPCGSLPDPWSVFFFGLPAADAPSSSATTPSAAKQASPSQASGKTAESAGEMSANSSHGADHEEEDDFDARNLGAAGNADLPELDPEMLQDFLSNADDLLEELAQSLLTLESSPDDKAAIDLIFRDAHTIKGTAGMFGFRAIEKLCHIMENMFDNVRKGKVTLTTQMVDALFIGLDRVKVMFDGLKKGQSAEIPINEALARLRGQKSASKTESGASQSPQSVSSDSAASLSKNSGAAESEKTSPFNPQSGDKGATGTHNSGQDNGKSPAKSASGSTPAASASPKKQGEAEKKPDGSGGTIKVDLKRLDFLVNLVGELVIDRSRFARIEEQLRISNPGSELSNMMSESILLFSRHMNEVQSVIMKIRMVPVGNAFNKFTRVVRDLSKQINKEIDLVLEGIDTELDKTIVEEIGDPLVHLIRNSVDHGIELPEDREKAGKPRKGTISLSAAQDGNMIVITVKDDGKGLQVDRIRAKAIANGLIKETDNVPDKDIFNLIFEAGFSTAEKVTNISGRGVGMDVVKKNIIKLKGIIELDSAIGKGTTTTIKLPLTLAIIPSLMVGVKGESYAIPLTNVVETIRMDPKDVQTVGSSKFVKLRDQVIPLMRLTDAFSLDEMDERFWYRPTETGAKPLTSALQSGPRQQRQRIIFVVIGVGEKRIGLVVDALMGQQEIVIKSLGKLMGRQRGVAGGCVLGNGRVALVLDASEVIEDFSQVQRRPGEKSGVIYAS